MADKAITVMFAVPDLIATLWPSRFPTSYRARARLKRTLGDG